MVRDAYLQGLWATVVIGLAFRARELTYNRSLWRDEASLIFNLRDRGYLGFTHRLDHHQGTPPGFFVLSRLSGELFGGSEWAYRLVPFVASIATLVLAAILAHRWLDPITGVVMCSLLALSPSLIYYAAETKQYESDVALALAIFLAADEVHSRNVRLLPCAALAVIGIFALISSHPAPFVLAPVGLMLAWAHRRSRPEFARLAVVGASWLTMFATLWVFLLRDLDSDDFLRNFWSDGFLDFPPRSMDQLAAWGNVARWWISLIVPWRIIYVGAAAAAFGVFIVVRRKGATAAASAGPLVLALAASVAGLFPSIERMVLFTTPSLALFMATAACALGQHSVFRTRVWSWFPAAALVVLVAAPTVARSVTSQELEELHEALLPEASAIGDDVVIVTDRAEASFAFYANRMNIHPARVQVLIPNEVTAHLPEFTGLGSFWLIDTAFFGATGELDPEMLAVLDAHFTRTEQSHATGASVIRFEVPPNA